MILGAHESVAGGVSKAFARAEADRAASMQIFTRNARGWASKPLGEEAAAFRAEAVRSGVQCLAHGSYLCNLGAEPGVIREKSVACLAEELSRCAELGISQLVIHPGANAELDRGIRLIAEGCSEAMAAAKGSTVTILLESTAGQGVSIGHRFEHLAAILEKVKRPERFGVCLDTCHLYAAGYDLATRNGYRRTMAELDATLGSTVIGALHLNDCKKPLGCRVDRHEDLGKGTLGLLPFELLAKDPRFEKTVAVLETPDPARYRQSIALLRRLGGQDAPGRPRARKSLKAQPDIRQR